jgi:Domain of unknown function (DUF1876)
MSTSKRWRVDVFIDEHENRTRAEARLHNPRDPDVPEIGDELAVSRALSDLAHKLLDAAAADIEQVTHRPAYLSE